MDNKYDELKLYFGDDYIVNEHIIIKQPVLSDIIEYGEQKFFSMVHTLTCIPSDMKYQLDTIGIDWNKISDFDLFTLLTKNLTIEDTYILFGELDFSKLEIYEKTDTHENVLANLDTGVMIDNAIYTQIVTYLRKMFNIKVKPEKAANSITKKVLIEEDKLRIESSKNKEYKSTLLPLISSLLNHPGFKYKKDELKQVGIVEFFDSVQRLQVYESTKALLSGVYSGSVDTSKINKSEFNWLRDLD